MRSTRAGTFPGTAEYLPFGTDGLVLSFLLALPSVARVGGISQLSACCTLFRSEPGGTTWWEPGKLSAGCGCRAILSQPLIARV